MAVKLTMAGVTSRHHSFAPGSGRLAEYVIPFLPFPRIFLCQRVARSWKEAVEALRSLQLSLWSDVAVDDTCLTIAKRIAGLSHLTSLGLTIGRIEAESFLALAAQIGNLHNLRELVLRPILCSFRDDTYFSFVGHMRQLKQLVSLELFLDDEIGFRMTDGCRALAAHIHDLQQLTSLALWLQADFIGGGSRCDSFRWLANSIGRLRNLQQLSLILNGNRIGSYGCAALADSVSHLSRLTTFRLELQLNSIGSRGCCALAARIRQLQLSGGILNMRQNRIGAKGRRALRALKDDLAVENFCILYDGDGASDETEVNDDDEDVGVEEPEALNNDDPDYDSDEAGSDGEV